MKTTINPYSWPYSTRSGIISENICRGDLCTPLGRTLLVGYGNNYTTSDRIGPTSDRIGPHRATSDVNWAPGHRSDRIRPTEIHSHLKMSACWWHKHIALSIILLSYRPTNRAFFGKLALTCTPDHIRPTRRGLTLTDLRGGQFRGPGAQLKSDVVRRDLMWSGAVLYGQMRSDVGPMRSDAVQCGN